MKRPEYSLNLNILRADRYLTGEIRTIYVAHSPRPRVFWGRALRCPFPARIRLVNIGSVFTVHFSRVACIAGPALTSRYLIPAMVDCLGRLAAEASAEAAVVSASGSSLSALHPPLYSSRHPQSPTVVPSSSSDPASVLPFTPSAKHRGNPPPDGVAGKAPGVVPIEMNRLMGGWSGRKDANGDPASYALLWECRRRRRRREGIGDGDPGASGEGGELESLLLSRALADMCMVVSSVCWSHPCR